MISIRKRGQVYQYSFEISKVDGKRKRVNLDSKQKRSYGSWIYRVQ